jgi:hypothetical protein
VPKPAAQTISVKCMFIISVDVDVAGDEATDAHLVRAVTLPAGLCPRTREVFIPGSGKRASYR